MSDQQEKEAYLLHARHEVAEMSSQIYDGLTGLSDVPLRTCLIETLRNIDRSIRKALQKDEA